MKSQNVSGEDVTVDDTFSHAIPVHVGTAGIGSEAEELNTA